MALREKAIRPELPDRLAAVDVVGTGGDGSGSLNLSTGSALVAAAAGVPVVKHGNRSISSRSGSADLLVALGVPLPLGPESAARVFNDTGFTFLFAPSYHPAMKAVAPVRQALAARTIFNLVGPLANPAQPAFSVIGAFSAGMAATLAETLAGMPIERAFVVHGEPGWDEVTPVGEYRLFDVRPGVVHSAVEDPADLGLPRCAPSDLMGGSPEENASSLLDAFSGKRGPHQDALVLGASLAMRVMGAEAEESMDRARRAIVDGSAARLLDRVRAASGG
jgi:anthranilate phosphoribosyltransferase